MIFEQRNHKDKKILKSPHNWKECLMLFPFETLEWETPKPRNIRQYIKQYLYYDMKAVLPEFIWNSRRNEQIIKQSGTWTHTNFRNNDARDGFTEMQKPEHNYSFSCPRTVPKSSNTNTLIRNVFFTTKFCGLLSVNQNGSAMHTVSRERGGDNDAKPQARVG